MTISQGLRIRQRHTPDTHRSDTHIFPDFVLGVRLNDLLPLTCGRLRCSCKCGCVWLVCVFVCVCGAGMSVTHSREICGDHCEVAARSAAPWWPAGRLHHDMVVGRTGGEREGRGGLVECGAAAVDGCPTTLQLVDPFPLRLACILQEVRSPGFSALSTLFFSPLPSFFRASHHS